MFTALSSTIAVAVLSLLFCSIFTNAADSDHAIKLKKVLEATDKILGAIVDRWEVKKFPVFLKAAGITHTSWEVMKLKFIEKLISSLQGKPSKFVIGFMGSSVTAGHDSPFNVTFPNLVGILMSGPLATAGITIDSRNAAIGNNPCSPYDLCPRTFAGEDADVVHWEQSYNCFGSDAKSRPLFEQFIRQSSKIPGNPIVVFTTSDTPNWKEADCVSIKNEHSLSTEEKQMIDLLNSNNVLKIVSELNKDHVHDWGAVSSLFKDYKTAGVQMWKHGHYEQFKCKGPYVKTWGCCCASWHPSLLGHELRAGHYSFFWLHIFRDAVQELMNDLQEGKASLADLEQKTIKHINSEHKYIPQEPVYESLFPETIQCYTSYEPKYNNAMDLSSVLIPSSTSKPTFQRAIFEDFIDKVIIQNAKKRGYKDFKYMYYGNANNEPLSFKISAKSSGHVHICGPPGEWGKFPKTLAPFYKVDTKIYVTLDKKLGENDKFVLDTTKAKLMTFKNQRPEDSQSICANLDEKIPPGDHVLTMVAPSAETDIIVSYLITP